LGTKVDIHGNPVLGRYQTLCLINERLLSGPWQPIFNPAGMIVGFKSGDRLVPVNAVLEARHGEDC
jgi:hypothetical protein